MTKWVYNFGKLGTDGKLSMRNLLGGKGANLAEMSGIGLPVPPGFTISTDVCTYFMITTILIQIRLTPRSAPLLPK